MDTYATQLSLVAGIGFAMLLGGMIGFEREMKDRPAGFRTHMLVAGAAAFLVGIGMQLAHEWSGSGPDQRATDPLRLIEAVVAGVAFIGAGTIFARGGEVVAGITTAASLLMVAAIGIGVGLKYYLVACAVTLLTLAVLAVLGWVERRWAATSG
jgi:putative Mg2+ transporter-C (MgtC) family protein